jgi:hypothetical protein
MPGSGKGKALTFICPSCCEMFAPPMDDTTVKFTEFWRWQVDQVNESLESVNSLSTHTWEMKLRTPGLVLPSNA